MSKMNIPEEITLADVIPIVKALPFPQRQALKQLLDKSDKEWAQELDKWRYFNKIPLPPNSLGEYEACIRGCLKSPVRDVMFIAMNAPHL